MLLHRRRLVQMRCGQFLALLPRRFHYSASFRSAISAHAGGAGSLRPKVGPGPRIPLRVTLLLPMTTTPFAASITATPRANAYVDGFDLYCERARNTLFKNSLFWCAAKAYATSNACDRWTLFSTLWWMTGLGILRKIRLNFTSDCCPRYTCFAQGRA